MRRTLSILLFVAGISFAPLPLPAQGVDAAQQQFVDAFLSVRKGEELEKSGDLKAALATYNSALAMLKRVKQTDPGWQAELVDFRISRTQESITRLQDKIGVAATPSNDGSGVPSVLPEIKDPLQPAGKLPPLPDIRPSKPPREINPDDPLAAVKQRLQNLEAQLAEAQEQLREEKEKNAALSKDMADAIGARKKAEEDRKKAKDLSDIYQASILELKASGEANGTKAKELEAKLAAANRTSLDTQAELAAAEERINQLIGRSRAMQEKAVAAAALPGQMKTLQAKLDNSATEAEKAKARELELKNEIASVTKERNDARDELVRLRELNKQTDKLMADNASLLKKLGEAEKQILAFKADGGSRETELAALRKEVTDAQKALDNSDKKNATLQVEIGELQKKVADYSKQISQFKADSKAGAEERKKMEDENRILQGIVMRVLQEDANRAQRKKMLQGEVSKLHIQSDALLQQINYLTQPVVKLSSSERKLFKKPVFDVQDPNTLVAVKTDGSTPPGDSAVTPPVKQPENPPTEPKESKTKPDELPSKEPVEPKQPATSNEGPAVATTASSSGTKLSAEVKPIAEEAKQAFEKGKFSDAEKLYDKSLQIAPNNVYLLSNRAVSQFRQGKFKQSEESFKKALAIAPEDAFCWSTIGIVYYSEEKYDEAVNALTKSLAINPRNPTAHNYLGITAAQKGWLEAAQKELESAVQLDPKYADAWFNLAVMHTTKQPPDKAEAKKAYDKAVEHGAGRDQALEDLLKEPSKDSSKDLPRK